jgi:ATP-binding cassette subfamily B protein
MDDIYDAEPATEGRRWRKIPPLTAAALRLLWQADRRSFVTAAALQLGSGAGFAVQLLIGKRVLDRLLDIIATGGSLRELLPWIVTLAAVSAAVAVAIELTAVYRRLLAERGMRYMEGLAHDVAVAVDLEAFEHPSFFDRLTRATWQGAFAALTIAYAVVDLAGAVFGVLGVGIALLVLEPVLVPVVVAIYVPLWIAAAKNNIHGYNFTFGNTSNDRERAALEALMLDRQRATEVHAYGLGGFLIERWNRLYDRRIADVRKLTRANLLRALVANAASSVLRAGMYGLLVWMLVSGRMSIAEAGAAAAAAALLTSRLTRASTSITRLGAQVLHLDDFTSFAALRDHVAARRAKPPAPPGFDELVADDVSFHYPGGEHDVLDGVSIRIRRGEVVALVGENGAGKTTLAKVLAGLYRPTEGAVCWDGTDIASYDPASLHDRLGVIFQDFVRYPLTAADNIAVANPDRVGDRAAVRAAARAAGADGFLTALPRRYDTLLSKDFASGTELSGGQWQRVALARAFFRDAPFIVLDEPTAALDARAEYDLFRSLTQLATGKAVLLISHRFSSVRDADRIYVLRDGRVVEEGSHDQLMAAAGHYAELYELQAAAYAGAPSPSVGVTTTPLADSDDAGDDDSVGGSVDDEPAYRVDSGEPLRWTRLPARVADGIRMTWSAGRAPLLWALGAQLVTGAAAGALVLVTRDVVDAVLTTGHGADASVADVVPALVALVALTSVLGFATAATNPAAQMLAEVGRRRFVALMLDTATAVDYERFESAGFHDQLGRARQTGITAPQMVASGLVYLGSAVFAVSGSAIALATIEPVLVPILLLAFLPIWVATSRFAGAMYSMSIGHTPKDRMRQRLKMLLTERESAAEMRALGAARLLVARWGEIFDQRIAEIADIGRRHVRLATVAAVLSSGIQAGVVLLLAAFLVSGRLGLAAAAAAFLAIQQTAGRAGDIGATASYIYEGSLHLRDFQAFLAEGQQRSRDEAPPVAPEPAASIEVEGVGFAYPDSPSAVLHDVSLRIDAGEVVALVGHNGSGKTTLAKLLCDLYRPAAGSIRWNGEVAERAVVRRNTAVLFQDLVAYPLTAAENIGVGDVARIDDTDAIVAAAERAGAHGFLVELPHSYDTMLARQFDNGADLSGGQWQRVALARALFRNAPFLVLDEPTASLDARAERELFTTIREMTAERSVLLISHRFSTVRAADRIYVVDGGRIIEHGTHDELMQIGGLYSELFTLQAAAYADRPQPAET